MSKQQSSNIPAIQTLIETLAHSGIKTWRVRGNDDSFRYLHVIQNDKELMIKWTTEGCMLYQHFTGQHPKISAVTKTDQETTVAALILLKEKK